jgi:hypothetical protein
MGFRSFACVSISAMDADILNSIGVLTGLNNPLSTATPPIITIPVAVGTGLVTPQSPN